MAPGSDWLGFWLSLPSLADAWAYILGRRVREAKQNVQSSCDAPVHGCHA